MKVVLKVISLMCKCDTFHQREVCYANSQFKRRKKKEHLALVFCEPLFIFTFILPAQIFTARLTHFTTLTMLPLGRHRYPVEGLTIPGGMSNVFNEEVLYKHTHVF